MKLIACKRATGKPNASSKSDCQGGLEAERKEWSHNLHVSPAMVHNTEAVFSTVKRIYGREHDDPVDDLDVNMAIWGILLNATLRAAVHLRQDHETKSRYVKNHFWNSVGQFFNENEKLIGEHKEITGVSTINFKDFTWKSTSLLCSKAYQVTKRQSLRLLRLCALWENMGDDPIATWKKENSMVFGKQSLQGYESNRRNADGVRVENIPGNHDVGPPRKDSKSDERPTV